MKLLTLNTHSLSGEYPDACEDLLALLLRERPQVIALQEVNQTESERLLCGIPPVGYVSAGGAVPLRRDNFAVALARGLEREGERYFWTWLPVKRGYGRLDEGLSLFTKQPMTLLRSDYISDCRSYGDWHTRMALTARLASGLRVCCAHTACWIDPRDPFLPQWERLRGLLPSGQTVLLMGDFNNPAEQRGEGYDRMLLSGFSDCFRLARRRVGAATVEGRIDGWRQRAVHSAMRIDLILCNRPCTVDEYRVVLDGRDSPRVSDHFGVLVEAHLPVGDTGEALL